MKLFVGIDVSSLDLRVRAINGDGDTLMKFTVSNDLNGANHLRDQIIALAEKLSCTGIQIGMESTSVYSWHPAMFLNEDEALRKLNAKVYTINAKLVNKFKEAYADMEKTDDIDALVAEP